MKIKLYNSIKNEKEDFKPIGDKQVKMYSCGPTVYNHAHIGNMRSFLFGDLLFRVLKVVGGYDVKWVMNITDIDDKTIRDSSLGSELWLDEMGEQTDDPHQNLSKLTDYYEKIFKRDISDVGIEIENFYNFPKATEYIPQMQNLIRKIYDNGFAYISDGSVYFDVNKWKNQYKYGRLKRIDFDNLRTVERVDSDEYSREQVSDFVLWKAAKKNEPSWDFTIDGKKCQGRPGWHLECSTMEYELFGLPFDIHTGGIDLKFPHHEDEIAQSHAGYGIDPTNYWLHHEFLDVEGKKMSKSAGNFFVLEDLLNKGFDALDIRLLMLSQHYMTKFNFTLEGLTAQKKSRMRVQEFIYSLFEEEGEDEADVEGLKNRIYSELADNLHTPRALAEIFTFINNSKNKKYNSESKKKLIKLFDDLNAIFAVWKIEKREEEKIDIPEEVIRMAEDRVVAKNAKDWSKADELRNEINDKGFTIKDSQTGYEILRKENK